MRKFPESENPRKLEYYISKYPELTLEEQQEKLRYYKRSCNWRYIEYYEAKYPNLSNEEQEKLRLYEVNKQKKNKIEYYQVNYPEKTAEEHLQMLNEYLKNSKKKPEDSQKFPEYYKKRNPDWTEEQCKNAVKLFKKSCNSKNIEYYERYYPDLSHEEHLQMLENKRKQFKENNPLHITYWTNKYPDLSKEECEKMRSKYAKSKCYQSKEYFKKKFPNLSEEEREKLRQEKIKDYTSKFNISGENNGMHRSKRTEQQLKENSPWAIEFYLKRNPTLSINECEQLRQKTIEKTKNTVINNCTLEYYLNRGMSEQEAKASLAERQATCRLDKFIKRYGEAEGLNRWLQRQSKWKSSLQQSFIKQRGIKYIIQSNFAIEIILNICHKLKIEVPESELPLHTEDNKITFLYDFNYNDKIIEFNGDFWHANPNKYSAEWINPSSKQSAKEIWERETLKRKTAENQGYKILYIWESEYKEDPKSTIQKCIDFLKS